MSDLDSDLDLDEEFLNSTEPKKSSKPSPPEEEDVNFDAELLYCIQGLGSQDDQGVFVAAESVIESLRGLRYLIRREDPRTRPVSFRLGQFRAFETHLIPLLVTYRDNPTIVLNTVKLLVILTQALPDAAKFSLEFDGAVLPNRVDRLRHLQSYKSAVVSENSEVVPVLMMWMADPLSRTTEERTQGDWDVLELFVQLLKHLLLIPDPSHTASRLNSGAGVSVIPLSLGERFLHDTTLKRFEADNVFAATLVLANGLNEPSNVLQELGPNQSHFELLLLDFFAQWFRMESAADLLAASSAKAQNLAEPSTDGKGSASDPGTQSRRSNGRLPSAQEEHKARLQAALRQAEQQTETQRSRMSSRHSRFGTMISHQSVFVRGNTDGKKPSGSNPNSGSDQQSSVALGRLAFIRNVFDLDSQKTRLPSDRKKPHSGRKALPDPQPRRYLSEFSRRLQRSCLEEFLGSGAASELLQAAQKTLLSSRRTASSTAELQVVQPQDWENFYSLSALILEFQRVRAKRHFREAQASWKAQSRSKSGATSLPPVFDPDFGLQTRRKVSPKPSESSANGTGETDDNNDGDDDGEEPLVRSITSVLLSRDAILGTVSHLQEYLVQRPVPYDRLPRPVSNYKEMVRWCYELRVYGLSQASHSNSGGITEDFRKQQAEVERSAEYLMVYLFGKQEYLDLPESLLKIYEPSRNTRLYLADLVVTVHFCMRILKQADSVMIKDRKRKVKVVSEAEKKRQQLVREERARQRKIEREQKKRRAAESVPASDSDEPDNPESDDQDKESAEQRGSQDDGEAQQQQAGPASDGTEESQEAVSVAQQSRGTPQEATQTYSEAMPDAEIELPAAGANGLSEVQSVPPQQPTSDPGSLDATQSSESPSASTADPNLPQTETTSDPEEPKEGDAEQPSEEPKVLDLYGVEPWEDEEPTYKMVRRDKEVSYLQYLLSFAHPQVIRQYVRVLEHYQKNSQETNDCVTRFLDRICDRELHPLFHQLSYFSVFDQILQDDQTRRQPRFHPLRSVLKRIVARFFEIRASNNPILSHVDLLFPKNMVGVEMFVDPYPQGYWRLKRDEAEAEEKAKRKAARKLQKRKEKEARRAARIAAGEEVGPESESVSSSSSSSSSSSESSSSDSGRDSRSDRRKGSKLDNVERQRREWRRMWEQNHSTLRSGGLGRRIGGASPYSSHAARHVGWDERREREAEHDEEEAALGDHIPQIQPLDPVEAEEILAGQRRPWSEKEDQDLAAYFEEFKEDPNLYDMLAQIILNRTARQIETRLRKLGIIQKWRAEQQAERKARKEELRRAKEARQAEYLARHGAAGSEPEDSDPQDPSSPGDEDRNDGGPEGEPGEESEQARRERRKEKKRLKKEKKRKKKEEKRRRKEEKRVRKLQTKERKTREESGEDENQDIPSDSRPSENSSEIPTSSEPPAISTQSQALAAGSTFASPETAQESAVSPPRQKSSSTSGAVRRTPQKKTTAGARIPIRDPPRLNRLVQKNLLNTAERLARDTQSRGALDWLLQTSQKICQRVQEGRTDPLNCLTLPILQSPEDSKVDLTSNIFLGLCNKLRLCLLKIPGYSPPTEGDWIVLNPIDASTGAPNIVAKFVDATHVLFPDFSPSDLQELIQGFQDVVVKATTDAVGESSAEATADGKAVTPKKKKKRKLKRRLAALDDEEDGVETTPITEESTQQPGGIASPKLSQTASSSKRRRQLLLDEDDADEVPSAEEEESKTPQRRTNRKLDLDSDSEDEESSVTAEAEPAAPDSGASIGVSGSKRRSPETASPGADVDTSASEGGNEKNQGSPSKKHREE